MRREEIDAVASTAQRLAVLLGAGVAPATAWQYLDDAPMTAAIAARVETGSPVTAAILAEARGPTRDAWAGLAAAWQVASEAGSPLAPTLRAFAASLRAFAAASRSAESALAAPVATARMVMVLPAVGVLFGLALGFDVLGTLFATPPGLVCFALALLLMLAAWRWNRRLVAAAQPTELTPGLRAELTAIAVSGGASIDRALASVEQALSVAGLDLEAQGAEVEAVLDLSRRAGVPAAELLRSQAQEARREAAGAADRRASVLAVRLMLPLGICILPAFMLLGVAPLLLAVVSSTLTGFP